MALTGFFLPLPASVPRYLPNSPFTAPPALSSAPPMDLVRLSKLMPAVRRALIAPAIS